VIPDQMPPKPIEECRSQPSRTVAKVQCGSSASVELPKWSVFPMRTNAPVLKAEEKVHQAGDLLKVATVTAHQIHFCSHNPVKIVKQEELNTLQSLFIIIQKDFVFHSTKNINPKLPKADMHHPKDKLVSDQLVLVVTVYPCQRQLQLPDSAEKISDLAFMTEVLAAKHSISKKHIVCSGLIKSQPIPVQPRLQPAVFVQ
jgi:hypothetical protein